MKYFLLIFLISCTKVSYQEVPGKKPAERFASSLQVNSKNYSSTIDLMVAFLWPEKITSAHNQNELSAIISTSRELKSRKEKFQEIRIELKKKYQHSDCPCVLESVCRGDETHNDEDACLVIENNMIDHDGELFAIYALVDIIKNKVILIGGEWIETSQDYPELPNSSFDLEAQSLRLSVFGSDSTGTYSYEFPKPKLIDQGSFEQLIFSAPRKTTGGEWRIEVSPTQTKSSLLFQGEIFWIRDGIKRQGFIFWEHATQL